MNKARVKLVVVLLTIFVVAIQIVQPARTNPPAIPSRSLDAYFRVPDDVDTELLRACGDCHSNRTQWPWYSRIAPLSWVITDDVNQGRRWMNLEDWHTPEDPAKNNEVLVDICKEIRTKGMPLFSYRLVHRSIALNAKEIDAICGWSSAFEGSHGGVAPQP